MSRGIVLVIVLAAAMLIGIAVMPTVGISAAPTELKSVTIELPFGDMAFPPGPGMEAASRNCLFCHSAGMVLYQPALSKEVWTKEVDKMIKVYKAPMNPDDIPAIVDYLMHIRGAE